MNPKDQAYLFIKKCLVNERVMRMRVLSGEHKERKVREIDDALKSLELLHQVDTTSVPVQNELFSLFA